MNYKYYLSKILVIISVMLTLSACMTTKFGAKETENFGRYLELKPEKSTKTDIYNIFGQPHDVINNADGSMWTYYLATVSMNWSNYIPFVGLITGGNDRDIRATQFYFNSNDVFIKTDTRTKQDYMNQWVGMAKMFNSKTYYERVENEMKRLNLKCDKDDLDKVKYVR